MSFRPWAKARLASFAVMAALLATPVLAQVEEGGLGGVDPWGIGFLKTGEPAMPTRMWTASRAEDLLPLMKNVRTRQRSERSCAGWSCRLLQSRAATTRATFWLNAPAFSMNSAKRRLPRRSFRKWKTIRRARTARPFPQMHAL